MNAKVFGLGLLASLSLLVACGSQGSQSTPVQMSTQTPSADTSNNDPWLQKPILNYLWLTAEPSFAAERQSLTEQLHLTPQELDQIAKIAQVEAKQTKQLEQARGTVDTRLSAQAVQTFNAQVLGTAAATDQQIKDLLGDRYDAFRQSIRTWWVSEQQRYTSVTEKFKAQSAVDTCYVYATQYIPVAAHGGASSRELSLPDKKIKFANEGWPGGYPNPPYYVNITRNSLSLTNVKVREVGPWNEDDNYWDAPSSRRIFNLPTCTPEAQAAFQNKYNGGKDQFGRLVSNPAGVDLSPAVASQIGMGTNVSSWVYVNYSRLP